MFAIVNGNENQRLQIECTVETKYLNEGETVSIIYITHN